MRRASQSNMANKKPKTEAGPTLKLKLLINTKTNKVVFAEAGKDCVDFLFHILSLPIATVIRLLKQQGKVGCLGNLYESVEDLDNAYIQPDQDKDVLLNPIGTSIESAATSMFLLKGPVEPSRKLPYNCNSLTLPLLHMRTVPLPHEGGFVKGVVTYMVMDDLVIKPLSTISSLSLMNKLSVKNVSELKEKEVCIGMKEVCIYYILLHML